MPNKIFLDTNVLIDLVSTRLPNVHNALIYILSSCTEPEDELLVSSLSLKDVSYIIASSQAFKARFPKREDREALAYALRQLVFGTCTICSIDENVARLAHDNQTEDDYDDALIAECAKLQGATIILSNDKSAFTKLAIPKMTPPEFAALLSSEDA